MRRLLAVVVAMAMGSAALVATTAAPGSAAPVSDPAIIPGAYIVTLESGDPGATARDHGQRYGASVDHVYRHALRGYAARMSETAAARVATDSRVASIIRDRAVSIAARPSKSGTTLQEVPTGINRIDGEISSTVSGDKTGSVDVDVAVIDTGIDRDHPDLNVIGGKNCSSGGSYDDGNGHGTHVAGTIAAKDDTAGVVGVAPGARLWAVRVLNNAGSGSWSSIICGVDWVTAQKDSDGTPAIEVANMSLGGGGTDTGGCSDGGMHEAICTSVTAGTTYVVAAGNDSADSASFVPAAYDQVITVSALADFNGLPGGGADATCRSDEDDTFANFSNYGADVDLIAPGVCIKSTWKGGGYNTISGTSMASPHVAGAAALYASTQLTRPTPDDVRKALLSTGSVVWDGSGDKDSTPERLLNVDAF